MNAEQIKSLHYLAWLILACVVGALFYLLSPILTPFLLAAVIAYICNPMVTRMAVKKVPRTAGTILAMLLLLSTFAALILIMVPLFEREVFHLIEKMPVYLEMFRTNVVPRLETYLGVKLQPDIVVCLNTL